MPSRGAFSRAIIQGVGRHVGGEDRGARPLMRDGEGDRARPGAQIEHAQVPVPRQPGERELDQRLRFRARNEHRGRHLQREPPELAYAGEIRDGLAVAAAPGERNERIRALARQRIVAVRDQPCAVLAEHVRKQHLRVERDEAGLRERAAHRDIRAHRFGLSATKSRNRWS